MRRKPTWVSWWWLCALVVLGCGGDDGNVARDPSSWAGMHVEQIRKDCAETVQCMNQRGDPLLDNPVDNCIESTARLLESMPDKQDEFISNHSRCAQFVVCDYLECAITDATSSYGETQINAVTHDCTAEVDCLTAAGQAPSDRDGAINTCIATNVNLLNNFDGATRVAYEQGFAACATLTACDFGQCFGF